MFITCVGNSIRLYTYFLWAILNEIGKSKKKERKERDKKRDMVDRTHICDDVYALHKLHMWKFSKERGHTHKNTLWHLNKVVCKDARELWEREGEKKKKDTRRSLPAMRGGRKLKRD